MGKPSYTDETLKNAINIDYERLGSWDLVAEKWGKPKRTIYYIAIGKYIPKKPETRRKWGLVVLAPAPVCQVHGVVHVGRCPRKSESIKMIQDMTKKELIYALENRVEIRCP